MANVHIGAESKHEIPKDMSIGFVHPDAEVHQLAGCCPSSINSKPSHWNYPITMTTPEADVYTSPPDTDSTM